jgi:hypothetical protein
MSLIKYINNSYLLDTIVAIIVASIILIFKDYLALYLNTPKQENLDNFITSLISVASTLIGFLLTIITVMVTFKKAQNDEINKSKPSNCNTENKSEPNEVVEEIIFESKVSKEIQFYSTLLYDEVIKVFIKASIEIAIILFFLLFIQFNIISLSVFFITLSSIICFALTILVVFRCMYIFKLYLNVHAK